MFAIFAFVAFVLGLILHLIHADKYVTDFELAGLALAAAHLAWGTGWAWPWTRPRP